MQSLGVLCIGLVLFSQRLHFFVAFVWPPSRVPLVLAERKLSQQRVCERGGCVIFEKQSDHGRFTHCFIHRFCKNKNYKYRLFRPCFKYRPWVDAKEVQTEGSVWTHPWKTASSSSSSSSSLSTVMIVPPACLTSSPYVAPFITPHGNAPMEPQPPWAALDSGQLAARANSVIIPYLSQPFPPAVAWIRSETCERGARVNELGTVACWSLRGSERWSPTPRRHIQINSSPASHAVRRKKEYIWKLGGFLQFIKIAPCKFKKRTET